MKELILDILDHHNDYVMVYVCKFDTEFIISDDGYILSDLKTSTDFLSHDKNLKKIEDILKKYSIHTSIENKSLFISDNILNYDKKRKDFKEAITEIYKAVSDYLTAKVIGGIYNT